MTEGNEQKRPYGGFSLFGVPYNEIDIRYASEMLYATYLSDGRSMHDAMQTVLDSNEKVVSRCSMLTSFSGTVITLFVFIAGKHDILPFFAQKIAYYCILAVWSISTMGLLFSLRHTFPPTWEFYQKEDFMLCGTLLLRRMGIYNITLIVTIISFLLIVLIILPVSAIMTDKIFS